MMHLEKKDRNKYTANEQYFADCLNIKSLVGEEDDDDEESYKQEDNETTCFPINRSLSFEKSKQKREVGGFSFSFGTP